MDFNRAIRPGISTVVLLVGSCLLAPPAFSISVDFYEVAMECKPVGDMPTTCGVRASLNGFPDGFVPNMSEMGSISDPMNPGSMNAGSDVIFFRHQWWFEFEKNQFLEPKEQGVDVSTIFNFSVVNPADFWEPAIDIANVQSRAGLVPAAILVVQVDFSVSVSDSPFPRIQDVHFAMTCFQVSVFCPPGLTLEDFPTIRSFNLTTESDVGFIRGDSDPSTIPEPATLALIAIGLLGIGFGHRRAGRQGHSA